MPAAAILIAIGAISVHEAAARLPGWRPSSRSSARCWCWPSCATTRACSSTPARRWRGRAPGCTALLRQVFVIAAVITAALSLDATVVLLTPVVLVSVRRLRAPVRPHAYATAHLANAASLLLPVSNLTNLLAFHAAKLSFARFTLADGAAVAGRGGRGVHGFPGVLRRDLRRAAGSRAGRAPPLAEAPGIRVAGGGADAGRVRRLGVGGRGPGLGGAGGSHSAGGAQPASSAHARWRMSRARRMCRFWCSCWRWASSCRRSRSTGWATRCLRCCRRVPGFQAARAAGDRGGGRRAGQRRQQPARDAGAGAAGRARRAGGGAGGADRGQHRAEPDLRRITVESVVARRFTPARRRGAASASTPASGCAPCPPPWWRRCSRCGPACDCWASSGL